MIKKNRILWKRPHGASHGTTNDKAEVAFQEALPTAPAVGRRRSRQVGVIGGVYSGAYIRDMSRAGAKRERRIDMRVTGEQERILRAAADLSGETLIGFVLSAAAERAADVVARAQRIEISAGAFGRFVAALDGPADEMGAVRRYAAQPSQIPTR